MTTKHRTTVRMPVELHDELAEAATGSSINQLVITALKRHLASTGVIEEAIAVAVTDAHWLTPTDRPAIDLASHQAHAVDARDRIRQPGLFTDEPDESSSATYDRDVLFRMLDALGLSPKGRKELNIQEPEEEDELARILNLAN